MATPFSYVFLGEELHDFMKVDRRSCDKCKAYAIKQEKKLDEEYVRKRREEDNEYKEQERAKKKRKTKTK